MSDREPMFQRRHYEAIAKAINKRRIQVKSDIFIEPGIGNGINDVMLELCELFSDDNPQRFDESRFREACGEDVY